MRAQIFPPTAEDRMCSLQEVGVGEEEGSEIKLLGGKKSSAVKRGGGKCQPVTTTEKMTDN